MSGGLLKGEGEVSGRGLSVVLLGARALSWRMCLFKGNIPVPLNPACAFSTVAAFLHAGQKTEKNSDFNSFCAACQISSKMGLASS